MGREELLKKQSELTERLKAAARAYYDEDKEIMSNFEYDRLYDELLSLENDTGVVLSGSPTQRVGFEVSSELAKQTHPSPMLSLNKTKDISELKDWLGIQPGLLSYKLDGLTVALTYEGGELRSAVTRGNGVVGEVVTAGAKTYTNLPLKIPFLGKLVLRGEAVIRYSDFEKINREIGDADAKYKNPRNLVSGSVRQLDSSVTAARCVRFYAFALVEASEKIFSFRSSQLEFVKSLGFETVRFAPVTAETIEDTVEHFSGDAAAPGFDLPVDGLVIEYDDLIYAGTLGATSKYPRDAMAFKWQDEEAETELLKIEWSASRTGLINPIAVFSPVELEGTTVSRASVHNVSILEDLQLGIGDRIKVYKANMIIPQISENLTRSGTERPPDFCPVCGAVTELRDSDGIKTLFCTNEGCPAKKLKTFSHFVSRPCMNIEGLSEQTLEKFIAAGILHELADVFRVKDHRDLIVNMEGFGEKSFEKLTLAIENAKNTTADRFLASLGIPEVGSATAKVIARAFGGDWNRIKEADAESLSAIEGVGPVIARLYTEWFSDPVNKAVADNAFLEISIKASGGQSNISIGSSPEKQSLASLGTSRETASPIAGKVFVITGSLEGYKSRDLLAEKIDALGGKVSGSVSKNTDYLINNDSASGSTKNKKARELGVAIITEAEFEKLAAGDANAGDA